MPIKTASKLIFLTFVALAMTVVFCLPANAQNNSTLGDFNKVKQAKKQKAPNRQLAKNFSQEGKKPSIVQGDKVQPKNGAKKPPKKAKDKKPVPPTISSKRRGELMAFVDTHHKELKPLLNQLRKHNNSQYQSALRSLDKNEKFIQALKAKSDSNSKSRYNRALNNWILSSKLQLLTAHLALKKSEKEKEATRNKIRPLIEKQLVIRKEQLKADAASAKARYDRLTKELNELNSGLEKSVDKKMASVEKTSKRIASQHSKRRDKQQAKVKEKKPAKDKAKNNN